MRQEEGVRQIPSYLNMHAKPACTTLYVFMTHTSSQKWRARVSSSALRRSRNVESQTVPGLKRKTDRLQLVQISAARTLTEKFTPTLAPLYWLPAALSLKDSSSSGTFIPLTSLVWSLFHLVQSQLSHCQVLSLIKGGTVSFELRPTEPSFWFGSSGKDSYSYGWSNTQPLCSNWITVEKHTEPTWFQLVGKEYQIDRL